MNKNFYALTKANTPTLSGIKNARKYSGATRFLKTMLIRLTPTNSETH